MLRLHLSKFLLCEPKLALWLWWEGSPSLLQSRLCSGRAWQDPWKANFWELCVPHVHQSCLPIPELDSPHTTPVVHLLEAGKALAPWAGWWLLLCPLWHLSPVRRTAEDSNTACPENQHLQELSLPPKADFKAFISLKCLIIITWNFKTRGHLDWKIDCCFFGVFFLLWECQNTSFWQIQNPFQIFFLTQ